MRTAEWFATNDAYLAAALGRLRSRLARLAGRSEPRSDPATPLLSGPPDQSAPIEPALETLVGRLKLSPFERDTLFLCVAMEFDTAMGALCAEAQHNPSRAYPTFGLALALFDDPAWDALSPMRPLRYWRLIEMHQLANQPLVASPLRADERIVSFLKGLNYLDDRIASLVLRVAPLPNTLPTVGSQEAAIDTIIEQTKRPRGQIPLLQLLGNDSASKRTVAQRAAAALGRTLYTLNGAFVPEQTADQETFARLWQRESALLPIALYVDALSLDRESTHAASIRRIAERSGGIVILDVREPWSDIDRECVTVSVEKPSPAEQFAAWSVCGAVDGGAAARLAGQFDLDILSIATVSSETEAQLPADQEAAGNIAWRACIARSRPSLEQLAVPVEPKATWDDIQLPDAAKSQLRQIASQAERRTEVYDEWGFRARMNRGLGISALFAGASGCGKTMAAEVVANALSLALYRIDLSAVVDKYIGVTEKHLRKLFDAAEAGGAILFFDEADALFGKRSKVEDSHDRYANIEINYLLQRMEAYRGIAILATNMKGALDQAFLRRLRFVIDFPFPGPAERISIWQRVFPSAVPLQGVDFERLARLSLTGGSIHNIALHAAFLAAASQTPVTMPLLLDAARAELHKMEKPVNENDFRVLEAVGTKA